MAISCSFDEIESMVTSSNIMKRRLSKTTKKRAECSLKLEEIILSKANEGTQKRKRMCRAFRVK